jgi:L-rhamnose mutarotase
MTSQRLERIVDMQHVMFMQKARPEKKEEYMAAHRECWPDLLRAIKESGIEREMIWMDGNTIFIYMMTENFDTAMARLGETDVFKRWTAKMGPLLAMMQDYEGGNIVQLDKVFDLESQLERSK